MSPAAGSVRLRRAGVWRVAANLATLAVLAVGLLAIAARTSTGQVLGLMGVATGLDGLDGWLARRAGGPRLSGAVLDLLADMAAFGLAPCALIVTQRPAGGWLLWLALGVYLCAALARLLRSCRQYAHPKPIGYVGLPMPACGWLLFAIALNVGSSVWLAIGTVGISVLAISRRPYPSPIWMWSRARGPMVGVVAIAGLVALLAWPVGLLVASAAYALYPLLWPIADTPATHAT